MPEQDSVHFDVHDYDDCCDDAHRGLWRVFRSAERLLNGSVQS